MNQDITKQQLAERLFEFTWLQHLDMEEHERSERMFQGQNKVLIALAEEDNLPQKELAQRLDLTPQSTAEFVNKLVKKGFATKIASPTDRRVQLIRITEKGQTEASKNVAAIPEYLDYLTNDEQQELTALLGKIIDGMRDNLGFEKPTLHNFANRLIYKHMNKQLHPEDK